MLAEEEVPWGEVNAAELATAADGEEVGVVEAAVAEVPFEEVNAAEGGTGGGHRPMARSSRTRRR